MNENTLSASELEGTVNPRLVIADDDPFMVAMLESQLQGQFECVGTANDAEGAVALVDELRPDVVLLDVIMPGGGARLATHQISERSPETAIVILSGDEIHSEVVALLNAGASAYLRKGIDAEELIKGLRTALPAHRNAVERRRSAAQEQDNLEEIRS